MRMMRTTVALSLLAGLSASAAAARQQPAARPGPGRVLEVVYREGARPAYQRVPGEGSKSGWTWYGDFQRVATAQPKNSGPVRAVNLRTSTEGGRVRVAVSVYTGVKHFDREESVAAFLADEGDELVVGELEQFGVAPFRITVMREKGVDSTPPAVANKTQSIEAAGVETDSAAPGQTKLTLRNLSHKKVLAVELRTTRNGRPGLVRLAHNRDGRALIDPGAVYETRFPAGGGQVTPEGYVAERTESITVASAVFDDGSYEGEADAAVKSRAFRAGDRAQLGRLLALLGRAEAAPDADTPAAVARLREQVAGLGIEADPAAVEAIVKQYPEFRQPEPGYVKGCIEISMHAVRKQVHDELTALEKGTAAAGDFRAWLARTRAALAGWHARL